MTPVTTLEHVAALIAGAGGIVLGYVDLRTGAALSAAFDVALIIGGFGALGLKAVGLGPKA